jgi:hypothetical protein
MTENYKILHTKIRKEKELQPIFEEHELLFPYIGERIINIEDEKNLKLAIRDFGVDIDTKERLYSVELRIYS